MLRAHGCAGAARWAGRPNAAGAWMRRSGHLKIGRPVLGRTIALGKNSQTGWVVSLGDRPRPFNRMT
jgi:hypothetical protein